MTTSSILTTCQSFAWVCTSKKFTMPPVTQGYLQPIASVLYSLLLIHVISESAQRPKELKQKERFSFTFCPSPSPSQSSTLGMLFSTFWSLQHSPFQRASEDFPFSMSNSIIITKHKELSQWLEWAPCCQKGSPMWWWGHCPSRYHHWNILNCAVPTLTPSETDSPLSQIPLPWLFFMYCTCATPKHPF
jgi:hypothetical protein